MSMHTNTTHTGTCSTMPPHTCRHARTCTRTLTEKHAHTDDCGHKMHLPMHMIPAVNLDTSEGSKRVISDACAQQVEQLRSELEPTLLRMMVMMVPLMMVTMVPQSTLMQTHPSNSITNRRHVRLPSAGHNNSPATRSVAAASSTERMLIQSLHQNKGHSSPLRSPFR